MSLSQWINAFFTSDREERGDRSDLEYCLLEPRSEKTGLRGFRPGPTHTGLYSHRICLDA